MPRIVRPLHGRVQLWIPYRRGSGNFDLLREICGPQTQGTYDPARGCFEVARSHLGALLEHLPGEIGQPIEVTLHGATQTRCVEACWNANPASYWECVGSCASLYHGTGNGPARHLGNGLAVDTEYTTRTFTIHPQEISPRR